MAHATARGERATTDRFVTRRRELADAALVAIAAQGFARTGLRDVAAHTRLSHGLLHYYFDDKDDLIGQAIWQYKSECARRYDAIVATSRSSTELADRFGEAMAATLREDADMHRLWYDLRNQSLFDAGFRDTVVELDELLSEMVWAVVARYAELEGTRPSVDRQVAYALFDGVFLNALIAYFRGDVEVIERARLSGRRLLSSVV